MFYICNKCGHQFVRNIQPCPDCGESKGFKEITGKVVKTEKVSIKVPIPKTNVVPKKKKR